jgi:hypothetical protein
VLKVLSQQAEKEKEEGNQQEPLILATPAILFFDVSKRNLTTKAE